MPAPVATFQPSGVRATRVPGGAPGSSSRAVAACTLSGWPARVVAAPGQGWTPRIRSESAFAGCVQSSTPVSFESIGAIVAAAWSWGMGGSSPAIQRGMSATAIRAPSSASFGERVAAVSAGSIGSSPTASMSPVSIPMSMRISVTPVTVSPRMMDHWIGAAPRYFGRIDAWTLRHPNRGKSRTSWGRSLP